MDRTVSFVAAILLTLFLAGCPAHTTERAGAKPVSHADILRAIADDIQALKSDHPQLAHFETSQHLDVEELEIAYGFKTHRATHAGGWTAAVPNPDDDGVWFHLDFHDPSSMAQIHTQPVVAPYHYRGKTMMLLILEGKKTTPIAGKIIEIAKKYGVEDGDPPR